MSARRVVFLVLILAIAYIAAFGQSGPPVITTTQLSGDPYVNTFYSQTISAAGGTPPYTWTFGGGNVPLPPSWLSISGNGSSALLTGTAPQSAQNQTVN